MRYTEGVCSDGVVILEDGLPLSISEILTALNSINQWQPIDTAPLNTKIMMYGEAIDDLVECEIGWIYKDKEVVFCSIGGFTPTHWQPLPQPPKQ